MPAHQALRNRYRSRRRPRTVLRVDAIRDGPPPGGEPDFAPSSRLREATSGGPLWHVPDDLANFASRPNPTKKMSQQATPGNDPTRGIHRWLRSVYTQP